MEIREAQAADAPQIWDIFKQVIATGDTYVFPPDSDYALFEQHWLKYAPLVAVEQGIVVGTCIVKKNQLGLGAHVANGSYMVHPAHQGQGIGKELGLHSLDYAKRKGFKAMQFNLVISTNEAAVSLWKKIGFEIVGTVPKAFDHQTLGLVDAFVMYQELN